MTQQLPTDPRTLAQAINTTHPSYVCTDTLDITRLPTPVPSDLSIHFAPPALETRTTLYRTSNGSYDLTTPKITISSSVHNTLDSFVDTRLPVSAPEREIKHLTSPKLTNSEFECFTDQYDTLTDFYHAFANEPGSPLSKRITNFDVRLQNRVTNTTHTKQSNGVLLFTCSTCNETYQQLIPHAAEYPNTLDDARKYCACRQCITTDIPNTNIHLPYTDTTQ